jgi:hypothetical protein
MARMVQMRARDPQGRTEPGHDTPNSTVVQRRLGVGHPLPAEVASWTGSTLGQGVSNVQTHVNSPIPSELGVRAFAVGNHIAFAPGEFRPGTPSGDHLIAHELTHVRQQTGAPGTLQASGGPAGEYEAEADRAADAMVAGRPVNGLSRLAGPALQGDNGTNVIEVELVGPVNQYRHPKGMLYRVGDAAGPNILTRIELQSGGGVSLTWFNVPHATSVTGSVTDWEMLRFAAGIVHSTGGFADLRSKLTPQQWAQIGDDPIAGLFKLYQEGQIDLPEDVIMQGYRGMVYREALNTLDANEAAVDKLLEAGNIDQYEAYARGLVEASMVRDRLETRKSEIERRLVQWNSPAPHIAGQIINMNPYRRLNIHRQLGAVQQAIDFWYAAFPLLSRFKTSEITPGHIASTLTKIKTNIGETRENLELAVSGKGPLDLMRLDNIRARVNEKVGRKVTESVQEQESSWLNWVKAILGVGALVGIMFLPGGMFIAAAIGVAIAAKDITDAIAIGKAANSGLHVDEGLMSQMAASEAEAWAVLSTILAAIGAAAAGFRVIRVARMFRVVRKIVPNLPLSQQMQVARVVAANPQLISATRTLGEIDELLQGIGKSLSFDEAMAIRTLAYRAQGVTAPSLSRESLDAYLSRVWSNRADILAGRTTAYRIYSGATEANPMTRTPQSYLDDVVDIARGRPQGARSVAQATGESIERAARSGRLATPRLQRTFYHYVRAGADPSETTTRIYLNLRADEAPGVMRALVREVVDDAARFPGVLEAKLTGPASISGRADAVVIYLKDQAASQRVLQWVSTYRSTNPNAFMRTVPPMTEAVGRGVSTGAEPLVGGASFGSVRADAITRALADTVRSGGDQAAFVRRALQLLEGAGVNPKIPAQNLPPSAP